MSAAAREDPPGEPEVEAFARGPAAWRTRLRWYLQHGGQWAGNGAPCNMDRADIALLDAGLISRSESRTFGTVAHYAITPRGEAMALALARRQQQLRAPHHDLGRHLADWLVGKGRMTWENCAFEVDGKPVRPDVFSLVATLNPMRMDPVIHEVKVSRADFLADVRDASKRAGYFQLAPRVIYATPAGMLREEEIPPECGWVEQSDNGWILRQRARKDKAWRTWGERTWLALALKPHRVPEEPG